MALTDNLISFWELEEASGTRVDSVVASGNDLTDNNTVTQETGKVGNCGQFTAANSEYLSRADNAGLSTGDIDFTVAAWIFPDDTDSGLRRPIISREDGSTQREYALEVNAGTSLARFLVFDTTGGSVIGNISATTFGGLSESGVWYYVVASHDSVNNLVSISINAGTVDSAATTGVPADKNVAFEIGAASVAGVFFDGRIDQVGFWKRVLSEAEIDQLYNGGDGLSYAAMQPSGNAVPVFMNHYRQRRG